MSWRIRVDLWLKRFLRGGSATKAPKSPAPPRNTWRGQTKPQRTRFQPPFSRRKRSSPLDKSRLRDWKR